MKVSHLDLTGNSKYEFANEKKKVFLVIDKKKTEIILVSRKDAKHFLSITSDFQGKSGVSIRTWLYSKKFGSRRFGTTVVANRDLFRGLST